MLSINILCIYIFHLFLQQDLQVGDHIVKFGNLSERNFADLSALKQFVDANLRVSLTVHI